jgi:hypothetical protein
LTHLQRRIRRPGPADPSGSTFGAPDSARGGPAGEACRLLNQPGVSMQGIEADEEAGEGKRVGGRGWEERVNSQRQRNPLPCRNDKGGKIHPSRTKGHRSMTHQLNPGGQKARPRRILQLKPAAASNAPRRAQWPGRDDVSHRFSGAIRSKA